MNQPVTWGPRPSSPTLRATGGFYWPRHARSSPGRGGKLTMDGPAERAGLGKGTLFRRFGTRAGIFQALLDDDERGFQERVLARPSPLGPGVPSGQPSSADAERVPESPGSGFEAALTGPEGNASHAADLASTAF
jgi:AcrR family transcriptional regulator